MDQKKEVLVPAVETVLLRSRHVPLGQKYKKVWWCTVVYGAKYCNNYSLPGRRRQRRPPTRSQSPPPPQKKSKKLRPPSPSADLHVGMRLHPQGRTPKAEVFKVFCAHGHTPHNRNSRDGYLIVRCKLKACCSAKVNVSSNQGDGWTVTAVTDAVLTSCRAQVAAEADVKVCNVCGVSTKDLVRCDKKHAICVGDFSQAVCLELSQHRERFISNGCTLLCPVCTTPTPLARKCASQLTDDVYEQYESARTERAVLAERAACEGRYTKETICKILTLLLLTPLYTSLHHQFSTAAAALLIAGNLG